MSFANKLKGLMEELDLTQAKVSDLTGIGRSSISQYVSGKNEPSINGDLLGTNHTSSGVVHRLFPPCLQKKKTQSGSCVLSDRQRSASCLRFFMRWSSILRIEFSICSDE